jgi:hypothetical protein
MTQHYLKTIGLVTLTFWTVCFVWLYAVMGG